MDTINVKLELSKEDLINLIIGSEFSAEKLWDEGGFKKLPKKKRVATKDEIILGSDIFLVETLLKHDIHYLMKLFTYLRK